MARQPITDEEYEGCRAFLDYFFDNIFTIPMRPEDHPLVVLDRTSSVLPKSKVRQGLRQAINDCIEASVDFTPQQISEIDAGLTAAGAPTLSWMRKRFWGRLKAALTRGRIRGETEYYAVRNAAEIADGPEEQRRLWALIEEFEARDRKRGKRQSPDRG